MYHINNEKWFSDICKMILPVQWKTFQIMTVINGEKYNVYYPPRWYIDQPVLNKYRDYEWVLVDAHGY